MPISSIARRGRALRPLLGALALGAALAALPALAVAVHAQERPATERPTRDRAALQTERLARRLDLSDAQRTELDRLAARYRDAGAEPGALWRMAAEVDALLTPAQRAALDARRTERQAERTDRAERRPRGERPRGEARDGERRARGERRGGMEGAVAPENIDEARAVVGRYRAQVEALQADRDAGRIDRAAFAERARALREAMRAEMEPLMSAEALARRAEARAARERADAARTEALRLTPEQRAAFREGAMQGRADAAGAALTAEQARIIALHRALAGGRGVEGRGMRGRMERGERPGRDRRRPGR